MIDPFDDLIEKTREKYRVSWEKSLEKFKRFCAIQDEEFEWAIKHGKFYPKITIEKVVVEAKPERIVLSQNDFDSLIEKLNEPPQYDEKIARVLSKKSPWEK